MNVLNNYSPTLSRRRFVQGVAAGSALFGLQGCASHHSNAPNSLQPSAAFSPQEISSDYFDLSIGYQRVNYTGDDSVATAVNGSVPAPTLRWKQGQEVTLRVKNNLAEDSSIHWHGIILPSEMDGVPGLSFDGIKPGETFEYKFKIQQSGTYWYHSHSGHQEQLGLYGAIVIEPEHHDPVHYDREFTILLSDWSDDSPHHIYRTLKKEAHFYNNNLRTSGDLFGEIKQKGLQKTWSDRSMWNTMRMSDRDISDVTGYTYTFLMNGNNPATGWTGIFNPGEKIRLRFINGAAMTFFDVRIPNLKMTVVAADGQNIQPVTVDDFRIGTAETYDVIVEPHGDMAYTIFAQAIDRSGYARGTLTPHPDLQAPIPTMDPSPILTHIDMGMDHAAMNHRNDEHTTVLNHTHDNHNAVTHDSHNLPQSNNHTDHSQHSGVNQHTLMVNIGRGSDKAIQHTVTEFGLQVDMRAEMPQYRLDDPGIGLREHQQKYGRKVLTYADLRNLNMTKDQREPTREIELHLTSNMQRYMWSINGISFADAEPLELIYGERVRITLVNDTMMNHPIHLHGMWSDLETGDGMYIPRKHTVIVQPGAKISYLVTVDARGRWAYHCHLLYHMMGMFREVLVR